MKRLVYNPRVDCYIKADDGVYDISPFVTNCTVDRKVNQVSTAQVTFRNPKFQFTERAYYDPITKKKEWGPVFHPMDPIVITMTRLHDRPIQVFTGYCDTTPYLQLFPGLATLDASCTLKRLQYTYWDPGLPFVWDWLMSKGWQINPQFGLFNSSAATKPISKKSDSQKLTDSNFGQLLFDILHEIGNWPNDTIYIERLPKDLFTMIGQLFDLFKQDSEEGEREFEALLRSIIGTSALGGGGSSSGGGINVPNGAKVTPEQVGLAMLHAGFPHNAQVIANGLETMEGESGFGSTPGWDQEHDNGVLGYWQIQLSSWNITQDCAMNLQCSTNEAYKIWSQNHCFACLSGPNPWQGGTDHGTKYLALAQRIVDGKIKP